MLAAPSEVATMESGLVAGLLTAEAADGAKDLSSSLLADMLQMLWSFKSASNPQIGFILDFVK